MQRYQDGWLLLCGAAIERLRNARVIRLENLAPTRGDFVEAQAVIAGDVGGLAHERDRARALERPVAVDHEARISLCDEMCAGRFGQPPRDAGDADVPCDVPLQIALCAAETAEAFRNAAAVVIAGEEKR